MLATGNIKLTRASEVFRAHRGVCRSMRSNVEEIQRSRILGAMAEETAMRGAASVTVARVIARAGVSRRLFYELFADIEDCFLATFAWSIEQARAVAAEAYEAEGTWRESIRSALAALLRFFDQQPLLAQLCIVHAAGGGARVLELRSQTIAQLCEVVDRGRAEASGARVPGPVVAEGVVGAVIAVLYTRLLGEGATGGERPAGQEPAGGGDALCRGGDALCRGGPGSVGERLRLIELHGELMSLIVLPYLGASTARKELDRPPPQASSRGETVCIAARNSSGVRTARSPADLSHSPCAQGDRRAARRQQPRSGRTRRHRRSRPDLEDPHPFGVPGLGGQPRRQRRDARHSQRVVAYRAR